MGNGNKNQMRKNKTHIKGAAYMHTHTHLIDEASVVQHCWANISTLTSMPETKRIAILLNRL